MNKTKDFMATFLRLMLLLSFTKLHSCSEVNGTVINFKCTKEEVYFSCRTENWTVLESEKNISFVMGNTMTPPTEIRIEDSKLFFIPPEMFQKFNGTRLFVAKNISLEDVYQNTFSNARELRYLVLSFNKLKILVENVFVNLNKLESLKVTHNEITSLFTRTFFGLSELRALSLSFNKIQNLPLFVFNYLKGLENLEIDNNFIAVLSGGQLSMNLKLMQLNFENNQIATIDVETFQNLKDLERVNLRENFCVNKNFAHWNAFNQSSDELKCCAIQHEKEAECLNQKTITKEGISTFHIPIMLILFISIFVNILVISLYILHRRKTHAIFDNDYEMTDDLNGSAYQVY